MMFHKMRLIRDLTDLFLGDAFWRCLFRSSIYKRISFLFHVRFSLLIDQIQLITVLGNQRARTQVRYCFIWASRPKAFQKILRILQILKLWFRRTSWFSLLIDQIQLITRRSKGEDASPRSLHLGLATESISKNSANHTNPTSSKIVVAPNFLINSINWTETIY